MTFYVNSLEWSRIYTEAYERAENQRKSENYADVYGRGYADGVKMCLATIGLGLYNKCEQNGLDKESICDILKITENQYDYLLEIYEIDKEYEDYRKERYLKHTKWVPELEPPLPNVSKMIENDMQIWGQVYSICKVRDEIEKKKKKGLHKGRWDDESIIRELCFRGFEPGKISEFMEIPIKTVKEVLYNL